MQTRGDGCGLLERLNLLITAGLADLEILHDEIAAGLQLTIGLREVSQLLHSVVMALCVLHKHLVSFGLLLGLLDTLLGLGVNGT